GNTATVGSTGQVVKVNDVVSSGMPDTTSALGNDSNPIELDANVPIDDDYDVWLPLASVNEEKYGLKKITMVKGFFFFKFSSTEGVDSVLKDGPWMIRGVSNKLSPSMSLLKEEFSVPIWAKFHDVSLVAYTSYGLSLIATK
ncbi:ribonuclease H-like domain-containing protein, partial [Tanacetum coccineum]